MRGMLQRNVCRHQRSLCNGRVYVLRIRLHTCRKLWRKARKSVSCMRHYGPCLKRINGIFQRTPGQAQYSRQEALRQSLSDMLRRIASTKQHRRCRLRYKLFAFDSSFQHSSKSYPKQLGLNDAAIEKKNLYDNAHCNELLLGFSHHASASGMSKTTSSAYVTSLLHCVNARH